MAHPDSSNMDDALPGRMQVQPELPAFNLECGDVDRNEFVKVESQ